LIWYKNCYIFREIARPKIGFLRLMKQFRLAKKQMESPHKLFQISKETVKEIYRWSIVAIGGAVILFCLYELFLANSPNYQLFILAALAAFLSTTISIKIPRFNGHITVSDTCIFLALLFWGIPAAVFVSVIEAIWSSVRVSRKIETYLFNAASSGLATWLTGVSVYLLIDEPSKIASSYQNSGGKLFLAVCLMALTQYLASTTLIAVFQSLKLAQSVWLAWRNYYLWTSITYFVGAFSAGLIVMFLNSINLIGILIVAPIIFIVYLTYRSYLKNLDALQESETLFRSSFDYATIGMALVSPKGNWLQVNPSLCDLLRKN
jgi:hypothetical protein